MAETLEGRARQLGYLGLVPQAIALAVVISGSDLRWSALAAGYGYAALIFSFLGGVWWGIGVARNDPPGWIFGVAVLPSLIAFATYLPWVWALEWPGPSLIVLGLFVAASPLVDRAIGGLPEGWIALRWRLSLGLGAMTLALGLAALR